MRRWKLVLARVDEVLYLDARKVLLDDRHAENVGDSASDLLALLGCKPGPRGHYDLVLTGDVTSDQEAGQQLRWGPARIDPKELLAPFRRASPHSLGLTSSRPPPRSRNRRVSPVWRFIESVHALGRVIESEEEPVRCTRRVNPGTGGALGPLLPNSGHHTASSPSP